MLLASRAVVPTVDASAIVDPSAQVTGDAAIGPESSDWMAAVIRGDVHWICVGARTNVQHGTASHGQGETHPTTIGDEVTIDHRAIIYGSIRAARFLIGMVAILLNGVAVGTGALAAAGSLSPEGAQAPPRSVVIGRTPKVRRNRVDSGVESLREYAARYNARRLDYARIAGSAQE